MDFIKFQFALHNNDQKYNTRPFNNKPKMIMMMMKTKMEKHLKYKIGAVVFF